MVEREGVSNMFLPLLVVLYVITTVSALFLMKSGTLSVSIGDSAFNLSIGGKNLLGFVFYVCSFMMWMFIIQKFDLNYIVPVATGSVYVLTFVAGAVLFNEVITAKQIAAVVLILLGILLMNLK